MLNYPNKKSNNFIIRLSNLIMSPMLTSKDSPVAFLKSINSVVKIIALYSSVKTSEDVLVLIITFRWPNKWTKITLHILVLFILIKENSEEMLQAPLISFMMTEYNPKTKWTDQTGEFQWPPFNIKTTLWAWMVPEKLKSALHQLNYCKMLTHSNYLNNNLC